MAKIAIIPPNLPFFFDFSCQTQEFITIEKSNFIYCSLGIKGDNAPSFLDTRYLFFTIDNMGIS